MANVTTSKPNDLLDPGFDNQPGDYTRASHGFRGDGSTGTLIEGLGSFIKDKFTADDAFLKQRIREEATVEADKVRNIFSGLDQRQGGWTLKAVGVEDPDLISKEITQRGERLKRLDQAYASGRITGTHYWTMLDVAARELRSKYPGYREHIDNVMSDLTGATPANQVVAGIRQDAARDRSNDPDKALKKMVEDAAQAGYLGLTGFQANAQGLPIDAKGNPVDLGTFTNAVGKVRAVHYVRAEEKAQLERDEAAGRATDKDVQRNASGRVDDIMNGAFRAATSVISNDPEEVTKRLTQLQSDVAAGKPLAGEQLMQVQAQWAATRNEIMRKVQQEINSTPGLHRLSNEQRKGLVENAELRLQQYDDIIINKNFGLAVHNKALSDQIGNADVSRLINNSDVMRHTNALNKMGGSDLVKNYYAANPAALTQLQVLLKNQSLVKIMATGTPIIDEVNKAAKEAGVSTAAYFDTLIDQTTKTILNPATPKPMLDNAIKSLYGNKNSSLLYRYDPDVKQYVQTFPAYKSAEYYAKMTSPEMTKRILELSKSSGDESLWVNYYSWTHNTFINNQAVHRALEDVKRISMESDQPFGVKFDPSTSTLSMVTRPVVNTTRDSGGIMYPSYRARLTQAIETFNNATGPIKELRKITKEDPNAVINNMFSNNGIDPNNMGYRKP